MASPKHALLEIAKSRKVEDLHATTRKISSPSGGPLGTIGCHICLLDVKELVLCVLWANSNTYTTSVGGTSMRKCWGDHALCWGTMLWVKLPHPKLNSSDFQALLGSIFWYLLMWPSIGHGSPALFKNVMFKVKAPI